MCLTHTSFTLKVVELKGEKKKKLIAISAAMVPFITVVSVAHGSQEWSVLIGHMKSLW